MPKWTQRNGYSFKAPRQPYTRTASGGKRSIPYSANGFFSAPRVGGVPLTQAFARTIGTAGGRARQVLTTTQHDAASVYVKKRMPRGRRIRWVKALRRNTAMDMVGQPTTTYTFNNLLTQNWTKGVEQPMVNVEVQKIVYAPLYSFYGRLSDGYSRDMYSVGQNLFGTSTLNSSKKFLSSAGVFDLTGSFASRVGAGATDWSFSCELDMYCIVQRGKGQQSFNSPATEMDDIYSDLGGTVTLENRGVTPFQLPTLGNQAHQLKILFKKRWQLSSGGTFTYQYRDPRNRYIDSSAMETPENWRGPGTILFLFVAKLIRIGATEIDPAVAVNANLTLGVTRTYTCKQLLASTRSNQAVVIT